jgi:hypothetical protein
MAKWIVRSNERLSWILDSVGPEVGDVIYLWNQPASAVIGWGVIGSRESEERIRVGDDEEAVTEPLPMYDRITVSGDMRVRFEAPVPIPREEASWSDEVESEGAHRLRPRELGAVERAIHSLASPHLVTLSLVNPEFIHALTANPELLKSLDGRQFERLLADLLSRFGYEIELQRGTKDGGVDIFALRRDGAFGTHKYLLQAKRWKGAVGVEPVRELLFLHQHHRMTKSCLATTSRFTSGAWTLAEQYTWQLELRDFERLKQWIAALHQR